MANVLLFQFFFGYEFFSCLFFPIFPCVMNTKAIFIIVFSSLSMHIVGLGI